MNDLSATDRCVKCGLCLPHCPTFALTGNEADSPRGRISLMQALGESYLQWSPGLFQHLYQCLHGGACEAMWGELLGAYSRSSYVLASKVYYPMGEGPNDQG